MSGEKPTHTPEQIKATHHLLDAIDSQHLGSVRTALRNGADPSLRVDHYFCGRSSTKNVSAFSHLIPEIFHYTQIFDQHFRNYVDMLKAILLSARVPVPEEDCKDLVNAKNNYVSPYIEKCGEIRNLINAVNAHDAIKKLAVSDGLSWLREGKKLRWPELQAFTLKGHQRETFKDLFYQCHTLLNASPGIFREMIEDLTLWASTRDAANAAAFLDTEPNRPNCLWANRILDADIKSSALAKYARDDEHDPTPRSIV